jgi:serine/threonine-protein kinase
MTEFGQSTPDRIGRWRVVAPLGRGELGQVFEATEDAGAGSIAIKLFAAHLINAPAALSAYELAARTAGALNFDVIVHAFEIGTDAKLNRPFSVAEKLTLPTLQQIVGQPGAAGGELAQPLSPERLVRLFEAMTPALDAAHLAGLVHRDLKPTNIFVSTDDPLSVRITDFGVSAVRTAAPPPPGWGATAGWHGPDAAEPSSPATPAMDVYALGLVAFFALTGKSPFRALEHRPVDTHQLWNELIEPLGSAAVRSRELGVELPAELDGWFARALAPHPRSRFRSVGEMTMALSDAVRSLADPRQVAGPAKRKSSPTASQAPLAPSVPPTSASAASSEPGSSHPAHIPPGVAAAVVQPIAFMPSLPPPRRPAATAIAQRPAERPAARTASAGMLIPVLLGAILVAIGFLAVAMWQRESAAPERPASAAVIPAPTAPAPPATTASAEPTEAEPAAASAEPAAAEELPDASSAATSAASAPPLGKGLVTFECAPPRCDSVFCDGREVPEIFAPVALRAGRHTCKGMKQGYRAVSQTFSVRSGESIKRVFPQEKRVETRSKYKPIKRL